MVSSKWPRKRGRVAKAATPECPNAAARLGSDWVPEALKIQGVPTPLACSLQADKPLRWNRRPSPGAARRVHGVPVSRDDPPLRRPAGLPGWIGGRKGGTPYDTRFGDGRFGGRPGAHVDRDFAAGRKALPVGTDGKLEAGAAVSKLPCGGNMGSFVPTDFGITLAKLGEF